MASLFQLNLAGKLAGGKGVEGAKEEDGRVRSRRRGEPGGGGGGGIGGRKEVKGKGGAYPLLLLLKRCAQISQYRDL